jgi:peptidoglycan lytic transglycosylase A
MATRRPARPVVVAGIALILLFGATALVWFYERTRAPEEGAIALEPIAFSELPGWKTNDARAALDAFGRSCGQLLQKPRSEPMGGNGYAGLVADWVPACANLPQPTTADAARAWFEKNFAPFALGGALAPDALFTGYYEPEIRGARFRHGAFQTPVYAMPSDLIEADLGDFRESLHGEHIAGRVEKNRLVPYATRAEIDRDGLRNAPILFFSNDPAALFFLQIQGSGRVRLEDGSMHRVAYAAQNGRPYTPVGRVLVEDGVLEKSQLSLQSIKSWMSAHPAKAREVMEQDQSYVFFKELPVGDPYLGSPGAEGVPLTPGASMAVDNRIHPFGAPFFVVASVPDRDPERPEQALASLFIAQDIGGAIRGAQRGDLFFGYGSAAESMAGRMKATGRMFVLLPKDLTSHGRPAS